MTSESSTGAEPPRQLVTPAEYQRRLKRAWAWWWAAVVFFGGGAAGLTGMIVTQREQLPAGSAGGMGVVVLFAVQRLITVLRRRPA